MTEEDPRPVDRLSPAQAEAVRRLLAGARHDEGIPDEVAARLDATITELAAERVEGASAESDETPRTRQTVVVPFRRRRWPQVLVAAAAVTVFGFGMAQIVGSGGGAGDDAGAGSTADEAVPEVATSGDRGAVGGNSPGPAGPPRDSVTSLNDSLLSLDRNALRGLGIDGLRQLRRGTLSGDLESLLPTAAEGSSGEPRGYDVRAASAGCGPYYSVSGGETFAASYRSHLALVIFHPELDGVRLVEIYDCEGPRPRQTVRTVTLQTGE